MEALLCDRSTGIDALNQIVMGKRFIWLLASFIIFTGCDQTDSWEVTYVAAGSANQVDVAFIGPRGYPAESDTSFVSGDSLFVAGDTTFVLNVSPPWEARFTAESGQELYLQVTNRTNRGHVSSIVYVDDRFYGSAGTDEAFGSCQFSDHLR